MTGEGPVSEVNSMRERLMTNSTDELLEDKISAGLAGIRHDLRRAADPPSECSLRYGAGDVFEFLVGQRTGNGTDARLSPHMAEGRCGSCLKLVEELNLFEPFLRDGIEAEYAVVWR